MSADIRITGWNRKAFHNALADCFDGIAILEGQCNLSGRWLGDAVMREGFQVGTILPDPTGSTFAPPTLTLTTGWIEPSEIGRMLQALGDAYGRG